MRKIALTLALLLPLAAAAQTEVGGGARASVAVDYKIAKGFHVNVEEEIRVGGALQSLDRLQTTVGVDFKPVKYLKLGVGYSLINPYSYEQHNFKPLRHRVFMDLGAHYAVGGFSFSVKERIQYTHRTGTFNVYQNTPDAFALKSRVGIEYKGWRIVEPGLFFEMRTQLNAPWGQTSGSIQVKDDGTTYYSYTPAGYTHVYNDRYRFILRTDLKLNRHHVLQPYALIDFCSPYVLDTNAEGTRLFSADYVDRINLSLGIKYTVKF